MYKERCCTVVAFIRTSTLHGSRFKGQISRGRRAEEGVWSSGGRSRAYGPSVDFGRYHPRGWEIHPPLLLPTLTFWPISAPVTGVRLLQPTRFHKWVGMWLNQKRKKTRGAPPQQPFLQESSTKLRTA